MAERKLTVEDIRLWVLNDEGLYRWWRSTGVEIRTFIRVNRAELTGMIEGTLGGTRMTHAARGINRYYAR